MAVIIIGAGATDRATSGDARTRVDKGNPANDTGTIDTFKIWAVTNLADCEAATFFVVSGNNYSTRDYEAIGSVTAGSEQTFTGLSIDVSTNDYIGTYYSSGTIERDTSGGSGASSLAGDNIPCTNATFATGNGAYSLYGTGTTPGGAVAVGRGWWSK